MYYSYFRQEDEMSQYRMKCRRPMKCVGLICILNFKLNSANCKNRALVQTKITHVDQVCVNPHSSNSCVRGATSEHPPTDPLVWRMGQSTCQCRSANLFISITFSSGVVPKPPGVPDFPLVIKFISCTDQEGITTELGQFRSLVEDSMNV